MKELKLTLVFIVLILIGNPAYTKSSKKIRRIADSFHAQALQEHQLERDSNAYYLTEKAISILDKYRDNNSSQYAEFKHDAGMFALLGLNDLDLFIKNMEDAIRIKYILYGESEDYYWSKECYANGLFYFADNEVFPRNIQYFDKAISVYEEIPQHKSFKRYIEILNTAAVYYEDVNVKKSIELCLKRLDIQRQVNDADSLITLSNLSKFYTDVDNEKALSYAELVLNARKKNEPQNLDKIRISHLRIASVFGHMQKFDEAVEHSLEARHLAENLYGINSSQYALSTQNTSVYYLMKGDTLKSLDFTKQAYFNPFGNKQENAINMAGIYSSLNEIDSCFKYVKEAWMSFCEDYIYNLKNLSIEDRYAYASVEKQYRKLYLPINYYLQHNNHPGFKKLAFDCILFGKNVVVDCMDREDQLNRLSTINSDSIKSYLKANEVAIEFWSDKTEMLSWDGNIIVTILRNNYESPLIIKLSKEKIYKTLRNEIETTKDYLPLYENIWKDIVDAAQLKDGERIYLSLDDILSVIPLELICNYDWIYMGDKYEIVRVSSTKMIPKINQDIDGDSAILYGGLIYDEKPKIEESHSPFHKSNSTNSDNMYFEIGNNVISGLRSGTDYLPWTKIETDSIQYILSKSSIDKVVVLQGNNGTEESFKYLSGNAPSIIHVSTHGFCVQPDIPMSWDDYYNYCMEHSGLMMAGVLTTDQINKDTITIEDGFLRSTEIAQLDLSNTKLLVLSACKTGLGGMTPFGTAGLQRAFKAAGVETLLLTLDEVDDAATYLLMVSFYKYLISGYPKRKAFRMAQQTLRESDIFHSFNYWSNFVLLD